METLEATSKSAQKEEYLFFTIEGVNLAAPFANVKEVINLTQSILSIPNVPEHVRGVINYQGVPLAIINIRRFADPKTADKGLFRHILVIQRDKFEVGVLVDNIPQISIISKDRDISDLSKFNNPNYMDFVCQEIMYEESCYGLLDVEKILTFKVENAVKK